MRELLVLMTAIFLLSSCGSNRVTVIDQNGNPIPDARLKIIYLSFSGPTFEANKRGVIKIKKGLFDVLHVLISSPNNGNTIANWPVPKIITLNGKELNDEFKLQIK